MTGPRMNAADAAAASVAAAAQARARKAAATAAANHVERPVPPPRTALDELSEIAVLVKYGVLALVLYVLLAVFAFTFVGIWIPGPAGQVLVVVFFVVVTAAAVFSARRPVNTDPTGYFAMMRGRAERAAAAEHARERAVALAVERERMSTAFDRAENRPMFCAGCDHTHRAIDMVWTTDNEFLRCRLCCGEPYDPARSVLRETFANEAGTDDRQE